MHRFTDINESVALADIIERSCGHLDLVASWEVLLSVYETLSFVDQITDDIRLSEFREIIHETNKFLTRAKKGLRSTANVDDAIAYLNTQFNTKDSQNVRNRTQLAYNKLKQQWIVQTKYALEELRQNFITVETEESDV